MSNALSDQSDWDQRHRLQKTANDADQAEWRAVRLATTAISAGLDDDRIENQLDFAQCEDAENRVADEIDRRSKLLGKAYPFTLKKSELRYRRRRHSLVYEFLLGVALSQNQSFRNKVLFPTFELLSRDVLAFYIGGGPGVSSYRFGVPVCKGQPTNLIDRVRKIQQLSNRYEWTWRPSPEIPDSPKHMSSGDLGIDVVAFRPFPDGRAGHLFYLGQCACGATDWETKFNEPSFERVGSFINVSAAPFIRSFSIPFHIPSESFLNQITREVKGPVFDRIRIVLAVRAKNCSLSKSLNRKMERAVKALVTQP